jgi:hypothetical protein
MTNVKLSEKQKEVIAMMRRGAIMRAYIKENTFYVGTGLHGVRPQTVSKLVNLGILERGISLSSLCESYRLTDLGKSLPLQ